MWRERGAREAERRVRDAQDMLLWYSDVKDANVVRTRMTGKWKVMGILLPSYGHVQDGLSLGRLKLPASLPFSKCQVKALLQVAYMEGN